MVYEKLFSDSLSSIHYIRLLFLVSCQIYYEKLIHDTRHVEATVVDAKRKVKKRQFTILIWYLNYR